MKDERARKGIEVLLNTVIASNNFEEFKSNSSMAIELIRKLLKN